MEGAIAAETSQSLPNGPASAANGRWIGNTWQRNELGYLLDKSAVVNHALQRKFFCRPNARLKVRNVTHARFSPVAVCR